VLKRRLIGAVAILLASGVGGSSAFVADARAQEPPPTPPTTTVAPEPAPDPAPPVQPAPKPKPKPKPVARQPRPRAAVTPPQAPRIVQSEPVSPAPAPAAKPKVKAKPKKALRPKVRSKRKADVASAQVAKTLKPVGVLPGAPIAATADSFDFAAALIIGFLAFATVCFGITSVPRTLLPKRTAYFVIEHQLELVVVGVGLFALTAFTFFLTGGR
jgi:hypothetical protein